MTDHDQQFTQGSDREAVRPLWRAPVLTVFPADSAETQPPPGPEAVSTS